MEKQVDPRIIFAAERTMLAWIRTGLALMGFGFVLSRFSVYIGNSIEHDYSQWTGTSMVILGIFINFYAGLQYSRNLKRLKNGLEIEMNSWPMGRIISVILCFIGAVMVFYLIQF